MMGMCGVGCCCDAVCAQESAPAVPREEAGAADASDEDDADADADADAEAEYDARDDELDAPRDYDDYTDNAHLSHHHD